MDFFGDRTDAEIFKIQLRRLKETHGELREGIALEFLPMDKNAFVYRKGFVRDQGNKVVITQDAISWYTLQHI